MEGTISTLDEILQLEAEYGEDAAAAAAQEFRSDAIETALYRRALNTTHHRIAQGQPLSESLIKTVHGQLLSFGRGAQRSPGAYKREQNFVGERGSRKAHFVPVAPEHLPGGMQALFRLINDEKPCRSCCAPRWRMPSLRRCTLSKTATDAWAAC